MRPPTCPAFFVLQRIRYLTNRCAVSPPVWALALFCETANAAKPAPAKMVFAIKLRRFFNAIFSYLSCSEMLFASYRSRLILMSTAELTIRRYSRIVGRYCKSGDIDVPHSTQRG